MENILFCDLHAIRNKNQVIRIQGNRFKILTIGKCRHFLPNLIKISWQKKTSPNWEIETLNPNMELFFVSICNFLCKDLKNGQFPEEMSFLTFP